METKLLTDRDCDLKIAADILNAGGNVIFPTETVYGLGADALNAEAVKNIFAAKGRPADNPLIVHVSSEEMLSSVVSEISDGARRLMDRFWPGALTIILKKCKNVPYETTGGLDTAAVRMPSDKTARRLIELANIPIAAPSANLSGKPSPTTFRDCAEDMTGRVDAIIDGGDCEVGVESTVVDLSGDIPILLRPGKITLEQLRDVLGDVETVTSAKADETPKSPGLKYKHYSPKAEVVILSGTAEEAAKYIKSQRIHRRAGVLVFDEMPPIDADVIISLGSLNSPEQASHRLFTALREMDRRGADVIYAPEIGEGGMWRAVRNRLYRAAGEKVLKLSEVDKNLIKKVLFVCTGNTCRSPMAEAVFNKLTAAAGLNAHAESAGVFADGSVISQNAAAALSEIGIDANDRKSRLLTQEMIDTADVVLVMSASHKAYIETAFKTKNKVFTIGEYVGVSEDVADPFGGDIDLYRKCRDMLKTLAEKVIDKL